MGMVVGAEFATGGVAVRPGFASRTSADLAAEVLDFRSCRNFRI
jgi:hypothetical protein